MSAPALILGRDGQVGRALATALGQGHVAWGRAEADLSAPDTLLPMLERLRPAVIFNAAAYTQVDKAEEEEALAIRINGEAPRVLAEYCLAAQIPLVHYSTDYVFDGKGQEPRREYEPALPLNAYGRSKRAGEIAIEQVGGNYLIFRTSWVYDATGKNFYTTMLRLGGERESLRIVADQIGAPTYAGDLATATLAALRNAEGQTRFPNGIYHLTHAGETSWHGFAEAIFAAERERGTALKATTVEPIASEAYPTSAERPRNSRLDCAKAKDMLSVSLPSWQAGLQSCIRAARS